MSPNVAFVASAPGDCPFLPRDLVARLHQARQRGQPAAGLRALGRMAASGGRAVAGGVCATTCATAVTEEGLRKIEVWTARHGVALADWPVSPVDPFFNVNTPDDAAEADRIAAQHPDA